MQNQKSRKTETKLDLTIRPAKPKLDCADKQQERAKVVVVTAN